ncbi:MAG TPA: hypothetical protein VNO30_32875 [Kofleriaceae bacterium]|nr:hypothetical protein [Kofleriaceae bacterium]
MNRLVFVVMTLGMTACAAERPSAPVAARPAAQSCVQPLVASVSCGGYKTYEACNADRTCMWASPIGPCIRRVE